MQTLLSFFLSPTAFAIDTLLALIVSYRIALVRQRCSSSQPCSAASLHSSPMSIERTLCLRRAADTHRVGGAPGGGDCSTSDKTSRRAFYARATAILRCGSESSPAAAGDVTVRCGAVCATPPLHGRCMSVAMRTALVTKEENNAAMVVGWVDVVQYEEMYGTVRCGDSE